MTGPRRVAVAIGAALALLAAGLGAMPATAAPGARSGTAADRVDVWTGLVSLHQLGLLRAAGLDHEDLATSAAVGSGKQARVRVEAAISGVTASRLAEQGVRLELKRMKNGRTPAENAAGKNRSGWTVWQTYSGKGGLATELERTAAMNPRTTKLVTIGWTEQGRPILAVKVTKDARTTADGSRPATVFVSAQHAREWITPEMTTRLLHRVLAMDKARDATVTDLLARTELWFVPVANPDGYDYSFTGENRLWRKNLRDNDTDGKITAADGVDPNRNFAEHWGFDNEGSSPEPSDLTYRGPGPASEPETQALAGLMATVKPEFLINYHSAAELLLYGAGFQVATPTPDDLVYEAMAGDDEQPAVPGYDPDISAELYTTNGDTDDYAHNAHGILAFTPEMSTCESVSAEHPDDQWLPEDCGSGFEFPDDEALVQAEFEKNVPFALATARSALTPDAPVSVVGRTVPDFVVDTFTVSYGDPQTVAVTARRSLTGLVAKFSVEGGPAQTAAVTEWAGGERYGDENDRYFAEYRAQVSGAVPGQSVEVWFEAVKAGAPVASQRFTYALQSDSGDQVLILANEDTTGANPSYGTNTSLRRYGQQLQAITDAGYSSDLWNVDVQGVPHPLGVLSHYAVVDWYTGLDRLTSDPEDVITDTPFGPYPEVSVAERQQYLTMAVRDYLNEGGKLLHNGELAQYYGLFPFVGGLYYGLNGDPTAECVITTIQGLFDQCLILADDFAQYWLGANRRVALGGVEASKGAGPLSGVVDITPFWQANGAFEVTSDVLPVEQFPQFTSWSAGEYSTASGEAPFGPVEGTWYAGMLHGDDSWSRLTRTVAVPAGATSAELRFQMSWNLEEHYDHVIIEARTAGGDDWTTLPDENGGTTNQVSAECEAGFYVAEHPFLGRYLTVPDSPSGTCQPIGSAGGEWNAFTGSSGGWQDVVVDLSGYAGRTVELSIAQVTDPGTGGVGAFVDDTHVVIDGVDDAEGFETGLGAWSVTGPPTGSPGNTSEWVRSQGLIDLSSGVATPRSVLLGYGLEQLPAEQRAELARQALTSLIGPP